MGWGPPPPGWERIDEYRENMFGIVKGKRYFYDHNIKTRHDQSPLEEAADAAGRAFHQSPHRRGRLGTVVG